MKKILLVVLSVVAIFEVDAQQEPQFTQNMFNRLAANPAFAGSSECIHATLISRQQWLGFEGNPKTNVFSAEGGFKVLPQQYQIGAGLTIIQDEIGPIKSINVKGALAYHHPIGNGGVVSAGFEIGMFNQAINENWITPEGARDGTDDPRIPNNETGVTSFDLGFGVYYYTKKGLYVGLSASHLNQSTFEDDQGLDGLLSYEQSITYAVMAGYNFPVTVGNANLEIKPSIFAKTDAVSTQIDINTNVLYNKMIWAGVSYRVDDAIAGLFGVDLGGLPINGIPNAAKPIKIGFAYDFNTSELSDFNNGSIEFMLNYCFKIPTDIKYDRYKSVRFL